MEDTQEKLTEILPPISVFTSAIAAPNLSGNKKTYNRKNHPLRC